MKRKKTARRRRHSSPPVKINIPWLLILNSSLLWSLLVIIVFFVSPQKPGASIFFLVILFLAILSTLRVVFKNTRLSFMLALAIITFVILRFLGVGNILNLLLIVGITAAFQFYFSGR